MKVMVAMSGGVDSSVAAALLVEQGHEVTGVTLKLWGGESDSGCCSVSDVDDARRVAQQLDIDHFVFNFGADFNEHVVDPYVREHLGARTPNPCIECNRHIKFDRLFRRSEALGFDRLATGHHVRIVGSPSRPRLARAADPTKDQSYVLHMMSTETISRCLFPVGVMAKSDIRAYAAALGLRTADKPDSQDLCFITRTGGRKSFLESRAKLTPGTVVDMSGRELGSVPAVELVTIGQRKGLRLGGPGERTFAVDVDVERRRVTVGSAADLESADVLLENHVWASEPHVGAVLAQVSAHADAYGGVLDAGGRLVWDQPQPRVAPGQSVVFYDGDTVLGGAIAT